jgi:hypothetical protein
MASVSDTMEKAALEKMSKAGIAKNPRIVGRRSLLISGR